MLFSTLSALALGAGLTSGLPIRRAITDVTLDPAATAEAQVKDNTATRAFTAVPITTSDGQCLFVDPNSGDFRENLTPVQTVACDGSAGQQWDVITAGVHNNVPGAALIVSSLTNACLNFDPRRAAGNQVLLFSCGGRADGGGTVTNSQLFNFASTPTGAIPLVPQNGNNATCLTANSQTSLLDQINCDPTTASGAELFSFGASSGAASAPATTDAASSSAAATDAASSTAEAASTTVAATTDAASSTVVATSAAATSTGSTNPNVKSGVTLDQAAVAEAQVRDNTATRAFSAVSIKDSTGNCLFVDPTSGDFRENLTPVQSVACDGSAGQQWDVITAGVHNNVPGAALIVSTETSACLNFDPRRAAGNQVLLFSCGGRADGGGSVTNSQLFNFASTPTGAIPLVPQNANNATCLTINSQTSLLDQTACDPATASGAELFTIG